MKFIADMSDETQVGSGMLQNRLVWRPVIISGNQSIRKPVLDVLRERLPSAERAVLSGNESPEKILEFVEAINANICFIDVSTDECRALTLLRQMAIKELTLVVLHTVNDSGLILRCLRCGAHEFLFQPFEHATTWTILDQLAGRRQGAETWGSVYVVAPCKPNIGSTTVATNLAMRVHKERGGPILLADLDPLYGCVQLLLKAKGEFTFLDAFANWGRMDGGLWSRYVVQQPGLDVLLAPERTTSLEFNAPSASEFISFLRNRYSIAFLDIPGLITDWYTQLALHADAVLLVTTNELTAIHTATRSIAALEAASCDTGKLRLIVNRYLPDNGLTCEAIETALRKSVFCTLPNDYAAVQKAAFDGKPIGPSSPLGEGLEELCRRLLGKDTPVQPQRSWSSLFSLSKNVSIGFERKARKKNCILELGI